MTHAFSSHLCLFSAWCVTYESNLNVIRGNTGIGKGTLCYMGNYLKTAVSSPLDVTEKYGIQLHSTCYCYAKSMEQIQDGKTVPACSNMSIEIMHENRGNVEKKTRATRYDCFSREERAQYIENRATHCKCWW